MLLLLLLLLLLFIFRIVIDIQQINTYFSGLQFVTLVIPSEHYSCDRDLNKINKR